MGEGEGVRCALAYGRIIISVGWSVLKRLAAVRNDSEEGKKNDVVPPINVREVPAR